MQRDDHIGFSLSTPFRFTGGIPGIGQDCILATGQPSQEEIIDGTSGDIAGLAHGCQPPHQVIQNSQKIRRGGDQVGAEAGVRKCQELGPDTLAKSRVDPSLPGGIAQGLQGVADEDEVDPIARTIFQKN